MCIHCYVHILSDQHTITNVLQKFDVRIAMFTFSLVADQSSIDGYQTLSPCSQISCTLVLEPLKESLALFKSSAHPFLSRCMQCRRGLAMRNLSPSVRPSVCPSVERVNCGKTVEKSVQIFIPYERSFSLVF